MGHYTQGREKKTEALLKRVLEVLVDSDEPIVLGDKKFKKINFSNEQVVAALKHYATPQEQIDGVVIKSSSTISKNKKYKNMITGAKLKRADKELEGSDLSLDKRKLTETEQKIMIDRLLYEKEMLAEKNRFLEDVIRQAEIETFMDEEGPAVNELVSIDKRLIALLEKMLILGSRDAIIAIDKAEGRQSSQIFYHGIEGSESLCYADDLKYLNITFDADKNGRIILKEKGLIDG